MELFVRFLSNSTLSIRLSHDFSTVGNLDQEIEKHEGIPSSSQKILFFTKLLWNEDSSLSEYGITDHSSLMLLLPIAGGIELPVIPRPHLEFLYQNYVAGLGRGATKFTTWFDIGLARAAPDLPDQSATTIGGNATAQGATAEKGYDENKKFDEFEGNDVGLFALGEYGEDDKEVDSVWESTDKRMDSGQKDRREAKLKQEIEKYRASNPKIIEQFVDLKRNLYIMSREE
eukprot:Gb_12192 [translate_table: standard]